MNTEQEREAFERHWHDFYKLGTKLARINGRYLSMPVQCAWEAWRARAALASPEVQALRDALEAMLDYAGQPISHPAAQLARAALAQEQGGSDDNKS